MMLMGRRTSACCGRCCRPKIAVISGYSTLERWRLPHVRRARTRNFTQPHFSIGGRTQFYVLRHFYREIGVRILFIDFSRGVAEQSDVKMGSRRHTFIYSSHLSQAPKRRSPYCNLASGRHVHECLL